MFLIRIINQALFRILGSASLFFLALCGISVFLLLNNYSSQVNYFLVVQSLLIGFIAIKLILNAKSGLLAQQVGVFFLIAFCCFPILEIFTDTIYWGGSVLDPLDRAMANFIVTIFMTLFVIGYRSRFRIRNCEGLHFPPSLNLRQQIILFGVEFSVLGVVLFLYDWRFLTLFFRGGENHAELNVELKSTFLIVEFFLRPLVFNIGLFLFFFTKRKNVISICALFLGICAVFPTGVPRFLATAMYIPCLLHWAFTQANYRKPTLHYPKLFLPNILFFGLFFIFPLLDIFRTYSSAADSPFNTFGLETMLAGHFDGYQMLVRALNVGEVTFGYGFLGSLLFFVPRSFWPTKPIGSAQEVAHASNLSFDNVSMTLVGEFYLNFWYFGILFGAILFAIIIRSIDFEFLRKKKYEMSAQWIFYFQSAGLLLFVLRGSFLSAFAYSVAIALTWITILLICKIVSIKR